MYEILANPMWDGISGIVAVATALIPVIIYLTRRFSLAGTVDGTGQVTPDQSRSVTSCSEELPALLRVQESRSGCMRALLAGVLNCVIWAIHWVIVTGMSASLIMGSDEYRVKWKIVISKNLENFWVNLGLSCSLAFVVFPVFFLLLVISMVASLRLGYASGAYATATGSAILYALLAVSGIPFHQENSLHLPQLFADGVAFVFVVAAVWSTNLAIERTGAPVGS